MDTYYEGTSMQQTIPQQLVGVGVSRETRRQRLERMRREFQQRLARIEAAIAALDANPNLEQFIETLQDAGV